MRNYPTAWQRRVLWTVFTYLSVVAGGAVALTLIGLFGRAVAFFQPVLLPFALAAVLAYLLEPLVRMLTARTRLSRTWAVLVVFLLILLGLGTLGVAIVPRIYDSTSGMVQDAPEYAHKAQTRLLALLDATEARLNKLNKLLPGSKPPESPSPDASPSASPTSAEGQSPAPASSPAASPGASPGPSSTPNVANNGGVPAKDGPAPTTVVQPNGLRNYIQKQLPALEGKIPAVVDSLWKVLISSIGGVLGVAGALLDAIIIPVYLYFLLVESRNIARHWNEYLPIRDSPFKKEVVSVLLEINGYIVAFFRGQLIVSTIDGIIIGGSLALFLHLDFAFFIGLLVVVLTFIPYLGIILCYIPAVLVAVIQYGDWQHPLGAVAIMFFAQTLESSIISPKIVGDSVGLHPVTVILSVFGWGLLLGGPIGAVLAVPLSATVKVLLRRYVWEMSGRGRHFIPLGGAAIAGLEDVNRQTEEAVHGKSDSDGPRRATAPLEDNLPTPPQDAPPHPPRPAEAGSEPPTAVK